MTLKVPHKLLLLIFFVIHSVGICLAANPGRKIDLSKLPEDVQSKISKQFPQFATGEFSAQDLDKLIKLLIIEHGFDAAEVLESKKLDEDILTVEVAKTRRISAIEVSGNQNIASNILKQEFGLAEKSAFEAKTAIEAGERLRQYYQSKGFPKTVVDLEFHNLNAIDTAIHVKITEGSRTEIARYNITCANSDLKKQVEKRLRKKTGLPLTETTLAEIRSELKEYFSSERFLKAELVGPQIHLSTDETQATLDFDIQRPDHYEVYIDGHFYLSYSEIQSAIDLDHFISVNPTIGPEIASKIRSLYLANGYARVDVQSEETPTDKAFERKVFLKIKEGPQVKIANFEVTGRMSLPVEYYLDFIKENSSKIVAKGYYNRDDLDSGLKNLIINRQNDGFLKARIISTRATYNKEKDKINFTVNLDEGPLTVLSELRFEGAHAFSQEELTNLVGLQVGKALKLNRLEESLSQLRDYYRDHGYLEMLITNEKQDLVSYSEDNTNAKLVYRLYEGPKIVVASITVEGNSLTKDYVILKELDFKTGDTLTPQKIDESIGRLQKLGHFSTVEIKTLEEKTQVSLRTVRIKVTDRDPGLFNFGIGVNNERTLTVRGYTGIAYRNFEGTGRGVSARIDGNYNIADVKYPESKLSMGYLEPYLFDSRMKMRINLTRSRQVSDYEKQIISEVNQTTVSIEQDLTSHIFFSYDLRSLATVKDFQRYGDETVFKSVTQDIATTGPTLDIDYRDHPFNPTKGTFTRLNAEYSAPWLGSSASIEYVKYFASFSHYLPISKSGWVFANNLRGGFLKNLSADGAVPYEKKGFSLGGQSSIRGFEGPEAFPGAADLGGSLFYSLKTEASMYLIKSELRFPIWGNFGGAVFYDGGAVFIRDLGFEDPYRDAVGMAFRYSTPVGAASLEWGWKLDRKSERAERPLAFHFAIGTF